jgi:hypothetical protein
VINQDENIEIRNLSILNNLIEMNFTLFSYNNNINYEPSITMEDITIYNSTIYDGF